MKQTTSFITSIIVILSAIGWYAVWINSVETTTVNQDEEVKSIRQSWYKFTNPLLECEINNSVNNQRYIPFEKSILNKIKASVQDKNPDVKLSLYFRNLNNGPWFWINENELFFPASLIKLPILIMYLHWLEDNPWVFNQKIKVTEVSNVPQVYPWEESLESWKEYSVKELLEHLIIYSDNSAINPLLSILPKAVQIKVFGDLWVPIPTDQGYQLSTRDYASFFRILYNASYLSKWLSEDALVLLSKATFKEWLRANIPESVLISHKFWEREIVDENWAIHRQLHDCGIVYHPGYPYLLCIMTKWDKSVPMDKLSKVIKQSSDLVYDQVSKNYNPKTE